MCISIKEYIIDERKFELTTNKCISNKVTLELIRYDIHFLFIFPKKRTQLICDDTGEQVEKSQWSPEIKAAAMGMKSNHSIPMWGYYSLITLVLFVFIGISMLTVL